MSTTHDDDKPASPEEEDAARALADALDGTSQRADANDRRAASLIRAAAGHEAPLGELRARGLARAALARFTADRRRARTWRLLGGLAIAAALAIVIGVLRRPSAQVPLALCSRSAGMLVPGPFPPGQSAAARLDAVADNRLDALRELRLRRLAGGAR
jgi:hypothetical protein